MNTAFLPLALYVSIYPAVFAGMGEYDGCRRWQFSRN